MAKMTIAQIMARGAHEGFTPYQIATLINVQLTAAGIAEIRPQMMYNYDRNGLINGTKGQAKDRYYTTAETEAFVNKYVAKAIAKAQAATPAPQTVEDIDAKVAELLALKSQMQGTENA